MTSPVALEILDATIFVDCPSSETDLAKVVTEILGTAIRRPHPEVVVSANEDADCDRATAWPGGFLFFSSVLEVYTGAYAARHERAHVISLLLSSLWSRGIAAVAACEYEDLLPAASGTGDRTLPWPA